jgi:hypothetical protein
MDIWSFEVARSNDEWSRSFKKLRPCRVNFPWLRPHQLRTASSTMQYLVYRRSELYAPAVVSTPIAILKNKKHSFTSKGSQF